jgi:probable F420-dependent oxidoreductase
MDIGLALPQFDYSVPGEQSLRWDTIVSWAEAAEGHGFDSLWFADHLFLALDKYGARAGTWFGYDPLVALAGLSRVTRRARLGTLVLCAQLRPAGLLAKALATLDRACDGRLVVGIGAGWYEPEYRAAEIAFERPGVRLDQLAEAIEVVRGMWTGGPFTYSGRHERTEVARCLPVPQQEYPPIWVGGRGDRLLEVVARHADGWNTVWRWTVEEYQERLRTLDAACERVGRDPATIHRSVGLFTLVGESERDLRLRWQRLVDVTPPGVLDGIDLDGWRDGHLIGTVDQVTEQVGGWEAIGVDELIVGLGAVPFAITATDDLELTAMACRLGPSWAASAHQS